MAIGGALLTFTYQSAIDTDRIINKYQYVDHPSVNKIVSLLVKT